MMEDHKPIKVSITSDRIYSFADPHGPLARLAWLPIPLLLALMAGLWVADLRTVYESRTAMVLLNVGFSWLASLCICILTARSFLGTGQPGLLMFGCGSLIWGVTSLAAATVIGRDNTTVTIHNLGVLAAALCHLLGLLWRNQRLPRTGRWLLVGYASALAASAVIFWAAMAGLTPTFFIQGHGGTPIRQLVLLLAVASFAWVSWRILYSFRRQPGAFYYWYGLGLALFATGLTGVILLSVQGGVLGWTNRLTQYLGSAYLLIAALKIVRKQGTWTFSAASVEEGWRENMFLAGLRQRSALGWALRYGLAVLTLAAANELRGAMGAWVGSPLPPYIMFYPAVMIVAVLAGFGPGIAATVFAATMTALGVLPPIGQFYIASPADRLALMVFVGMGLSMSAIAALYRRSRDKAAAYDSGKALRESQARLATFAQATFEGIVESEDGRIVDCNEQLARMLGYSTEELKGMEIADLVAPEDRDRVMAVIRQGRESALEHALLRKDGTRIVIEAHGRNVSFGSTRRHTAVRDITESKQAEQALQYTLQRFYLMLANLSCGVLLMTDEERVEFVNQAFCDSYGLPAPAELMDLTSGQLLQKILPTFAQTDQAVARIREILQEMQPVKGEEFAMRDGRTAMRDFVPLTVDGQSCGRLWLHVDITKVKQTEEALRKSHNQFTVLMQNVNAGIALIDEHGKFVIVNPVFLRLFDLPSESSIKNVNDRDWGQWQVFKEDGELLDVDEHPVRKAAMTGKAVRNCLVAVKSPSQTGLKWMQISAEPILKPNGQMDAVICTYHDITERRQAEESLRRTADELARSNKDLEQFAHVASHDLQEPLRTVKSFLELLARRSSAKLDDKDRQYIGFAVDGASRMQNLIADLLTYSRSGSKGLNIANISLRDCAGKALAALSSSIGEAGATVTIGDLPMAKADATWIGQVFQNLLANAVKFRRKDVRPEVSITATQQDKQYVVCVRDNGIGIPAEQCDRVFEMFQRLHTRQEYPGTGIGLAICKKVIEQHGGHIWVESNKAGEGSSFYFTVPAADGASGGDQDVWPQQRVAASPETLDGAVAVRRALEAAQEEHRQAAHLYESIAWNLPNGAVHILDRDFRFVFSGGEALGRLGLSHEAVLGKAINEVLPPETLAVVEPNFWRALDGHTVTFEVEMGGIAFQVTAVPLKGQGSEVEQILVLSVDISARKRAEEVVRQSEERFATAFHENISGMAISRLSDGHIIDVNNRWLAMFGFARKDVIGKVVSQKAWKFPEERQQMVRDLDQHGVFQDREVQFCRANGEAWVGLASGRRTSLGGESVIMTSVIDITDRKRAEEAVRESERRLLGVLESMPDAFVSFDSDLRYTYVNKNAERLQAAHRDELLGKDVRAVYPDAESYKSICQYERVLRERQPIVFVSHHAGFDRWVEVSAFPTPNGVSVFYKDVSDKARAEDALHQSEAKYRTIVETAHEGIWITDADRKTVFANRRMADMLGVAVKDLLGRCPAEFLDAGQEPVRQEVWEQLKTGAQVSREFRFRRQDGSTLWVISSASTMLDGDGRPYRTVSMLVDITERKKAEEALQTTVAKLERSNRELEQFAYISAHDLQEPLRQVRAYVGLLKDRHSDKFDGKAAQYFGFVYDGAARMSELVSGLLAYASVGTREKQREAVSCNAALDAALANLQVSIDEAHAWITHDDLPTAMGDSAQLTQLFQNLVSNAIKFRRDGVKPEIHIGVRKVNGHSSLASGTAPSEPNDQTPMTNDAAKQPMTHGFYWLFSVHDNGIGIDPEYHKQVFHIFQRLHDREKYSGTGIGLAICKKIVERHNGRIWVESTPSEGSTFFFTIPTDGK